MPRRHPQEMRRQVNEPGRVGPRVNQFASPFVISAVYTWAGQDKIDGGEREGPRTNQGGRPSAGSGSSRGAGVERFRQTDHEINHFNTLDATWLPQPDFGKRWPITNGYARHLNGS